MIQDELTAYLADKTAAEDRIFPLLADAKTPVPYMTYIVASAIPEVALAGGVEITNSRIQIDVYSRTYGEAHEVAAAIGAALAAWTVRSVPIQSQDFYEPDTKLFRVSTDFSFWH